MPESAQCLGCGYLLRDLPEPRCPECGREFDPADPDSYAVPGEPSKLERWLIQHVHPPGAMWFLLVTPAAAAVCWRLSTPQAYFIMPFVMDVAPEVGLLVVLATLLIVGDFGWRWAGLSRARVLHYQEVVSRFDAKPRAWRAATVVVVLFVVSFVTPWPVMLRFYVSWPWLQAEANACLSRPGSDVRRYVGVTRVEHVFGQTRGFVFFQTGWNGSRYGYVYRPPGSDSRRSTTSWRWIAPYWYIERW